jgi:pseudaminic acid synthase
MRNTPSMERTGPLFIAEISANHLGSFERAKLLVSSAISSGAGAVKLQTYTADTMTLNIDSDDFRISPSHTLWGGEKLYDLYQRAHTPWEWHSELFEICKQAKVIGFSTPFDVSATTFLESINAPMYKVSSMETGDLALIRTVAETGKPIIISTGATNWNEIEEVVETVLRTGNKDLTLLLCTSAYPADPGETHLRRMQKLQDSFGLPVGISDHTLGIGVSIAAIALGATVIERHITIRRTDGGPDAAFSLEPEEFKLLVDEGNRAFKSLGKSEWQFSDSESEARRIRRSLYIVENVKKGELISEQNIRAIRPGAGCSPKYLNQIIGKFFDKDYAKGTPMRLDFAVEND